MAKSHYDVVIVGGGPIGLSLALALANIPLNVALIETKSFSPTVFSDARIIGLTHTSQQFFSHLHLNKALLNDGCELTSAEICLRGHFGRLHLAAADYQRSTFGTVIPMQNLMQILHHACAENTAITHYCPATVIDQQVEATQIVITCDIQSKTKKITADLLVGADGQHSQVRKSAGIGVKQKDYQHVAVVGKVKLSAAAAPHRAYEYLWSQGLLALLPLVDGTHGIITTLSTPDFAKTKTWDTAAWKNYLSQQTAHTFDDFEILTALQHYPLSLSIADQCIAPRTVLIGNAAHSLHPIAAQGLNLGLRDVATLAELFTENHPSIDALLQQYAKKRKTDIKKVLQMTDGLWKMLGTDPIHSSLQTIGWRLLQCIPQSKKILAERAMGFIGDVPWSMLGNP